MSAFVVSERTMHSVVDAVRDLYFERTQCGGVVDFGPIRLVDHASFDKLGPALFALNVEAVAQRYKEREPQPVFRWKPGRPWINRAQRLKSLQCLRYQCSEGDVPKTALYQALATAIGEYAQDIVATSPEYRAAHWCEPDTAAA